VVVPLWAVVTLETSQAVTVRCHHQITLAKLEVTIFDVSAAKVQLVKSASLVALSPSDPVDYLALVATVAARVLVPT
jgi:hypothetical protein